MTAFLFISFISIVAEIKCLPYSLLFYFILFYFFGGRNAAKNIKSDGCVPVFYVLGHTVVQTPKCKQRKFRGCQTQDAITRICVTKRKRFGRLFEIAAVDTRYKRYKQGPSERHIHEKNLKM